MDMEQSRLRYGVQDSPEYILGERRACIPNCLTMPQCPLLDSSLNKSHKDSIRERDLVVGEAQADLRSSY